MHHGGCSILGHNGLERLDIAKLPAESSSNGAVKVKKYIVYKHKHQSGENLNYESKNMVTREFVKIEGNTQNGYRKMEYRDKSYLVVEKHFFPNGSLKSVQQGYIGFLYLNKDMERTREPVFYMGISREYDSGGELIKETDHEGPFRFTLYKVRELLLEKYKIDFSEPDKSAGIDRGIRANGTGYWRLDIPLSINERREKWLRMTLDGHSGEMISQEEKIYY